jgi:hypothetical protein
MNEIKFLPHEMEIVDLLEKVLPVPEHWYSRSEKQTHDHPGCGAGMEIMGKVVATIEYPEEEVRAVLLENPGILCGTISHCDKFDGESEWEYRWELIGVAGNKFTFEAREAQ